MSEIIRSTRAVRYHVASLWNWKEVYLGRFIEPIAFFALLVPGVIGISGGGDDAQRYLSFAYIGMVGLISFRAASAVMVDVANDRKWGVFAHYRLSGGSTLGYIGSLVLFYIVVSAVQMLSVTIVFVLLSDGLRWPFDGGFMVPFAAALYLAAWVCLGVIVGVHVKNYARRDLLVTLTALPVILSAPVFYPLGSAPQYLQWIALLNPLTYQLNSLRGGDTLGLLIGAVGSLVVTLSLALFMVSRAGLTTTER